MKYCMAMSQKVIIFIFVRFIYWDPIMFHFRRNKCLERISTSFNYMVHFYIRLINKIHLTYPWNIFYNIALHCLKNKNIYIHKLFIQTQFCMYLHYEVVQSIQISFAEKKWIYLFYTNKRCKYKHFIKFPSSSIW